jgi:hypothetical protein
MRGVLAIIIGLFVAFVSAEVLGFILDWVIEQNYVAWLIWLLILILLIPFVGISASMIAYSKLHAFEKTSSQSSTEIRRYRAVRRRMTRGPITQGLRARTRKRAAATLSRHGCFGSRWAHMSQARLIDTGLCISRSVMAASSGYRVVIGPPSVWAAISIRASTSV